MMATWEISMIIKKNNCYEGATYKLGTFTNNAGEEYNIILIIHSRGFELGFETFVELGLETFGVTMFCMNFPTKKKLVEFLEWAKETQGWNLNLPEPLENAIDKLILDAKL